MDSELNVRLDAALVAQLDQVHLRLMGRVRGSARGDRPTQRRGTGGDFLDLRAYAPGDDIRRLDWHLFGRLDALFVRLYEAPREHTLHLILDTSGSMARGKARYARALCASLAYLALRHMDKVALFAPAARGDLGAGPFRGRPAIRRIFRFLDAVPFADDFCLGDALQRYLRTRRRGSVIVVSDFLYEEDLAAATSRLGQEGLGGALIHLLARSEREPEMGHFALQDAESGVHLNVSADAALLVAYQRELESLSARVSAAAKRANLAYVEATSDVPLRAFLLGDAAHKGVVSTRRG